MYIDSVKRVTMTRIVVTLFAVLLSSCASIPLGTMLDFSTFGKEDVVNIQPQDVRAKIQLDKPAEADIRSVKLAVELSTVKGMKTFSFPLQLLNERSIEPVEGFFSTAPGKTEYCFKLSDDAIANFITAQQILQQEKSEEFKLSVSSDFKTLPPDVTEIGLSIFLQIREEQGFVTLFDNAKLAVQHDEN